MCRRHVSGAGAPKNTHKVHPGLPFPCHHVCPWCASPWSTVGSLKPHLEWLGHRNLNSIRIFVRDWCITVETDLPDVEMKQKKGTCVTHKTYVPSPAGNTHTFAVSYSFFCDRPPFGTFPLLPRPDGVSTGRPSVQTRHAKHRHGSISRPAHRARPPGCPQSEGAIPARAWSI